MWNCRNCDKSVLDDNTTICPYCKIDNKDLYIVSMQEEDNKEPLKKRVKRFLIGLYIVVFYICIFTGYLRARIPSIEVIENYLPADASKESFQPVNGYVGQYVVEPTYKYIVDEVIPYKDKDVKLGDSEKIILIHYKITNISKEEKLKLNNPIFSAMLVDSRYDLKTCETYLPNSTKYKAHSTTKELNCGESISGWYGYIIKDYYDEIYLYFDEYSGVYLTGYTVEKETSEVEE